MWKEFMAGKNLKLQVKKALRRKAGKLPQTCIRLGSANKCTQANAHSNDRAVCRAPLPVLYGEGECLTPLAPPKAMDAPSGDCWPSTDLDLMYCNLRAKEG